MRSFFIGVGLFFAFVVFAPITVLWVFGEQYQGRQCEFWQTPHGLLLEVAAMCDLLFIWPLILGALR